MKTLKIFKIFLRLKKNEFFQWIKLDASGLIETFGTILGIFILILTIPTGLGFILNKIFPIFFSFIGVLNSFHLSKFLFNVANYWILGMMFLSLLAISIITLGGIYFIMKEIIIQGIVNFCRFLKSNWEKAKKIYGDRNENR